MKLKKGTLLFLLLTCLAYTTLAQEVDNKLDGNDVTIDDKGIITGCKDAFSKTSIIIPEKIGETTIEGIGDNAFNDKSLVAVAFADDSEVKTIGSFTFANNKITELTLPTTLTSIGQYAFLNNLITELTFPENSQLTTIVNHAFLNNKIAELTLPASLTTIGIEAFANNKITALTLPTALTTIGSGAFFKNQITELTFPNDSQLKTIGYNAFQGNDGEDAGGNKITTLTLPPSLMVIGDSAFYNNSLITVTFNDSNKSQIKSIGSYAFSGNTGLTGITLPKYAGGDDVKYKDSDGNDYDPNDENKNTFTNFDRSLVAVIPTHTLTADDVTVENGIITKCHCGNFVSNSIEIPVQIGGKTITGIADKSWPDGVFKNKNLIAVAFEEGSQITSIGDNAFYDNQITELTLPEDSQLASIGDNAFSANQITELTLPTSLTTIRYRAFLNNQITELTFPEYSQLATIGNNAFQNNKITELTFPEYSQLATIGNNAFQNNKITELSLPTILTTIGNQAFTINKITKLTFPDDSQLTTIGNNAFFNNPLPSFRLPLATKEGFRTYWKDGISSDLIADLTIPQVDFRKTFELVSIEQVTLTLIISGVGLVEGLKAGKNPVDKGQLLALTAKPNGGNELEKWVFGSDISTSTSTYTIPAEETQNDLRIEVHFKEKDISDPIELTISTDGQGTVTPNIGINTYEKGTMVDLTATPDEGWRFDKWVIGSNEITNNPTDVTVDADTTATAHFVQLVKLTLATIGEGSINPSVEPNDKGEYDINTKVTLTAEPNTGWRFDKWEITGEEDENGKTTTITLDQDKTAIAHFVQQVTLTLTIEETGASGEVSGLSAGENKIDKGVDFKLEATPASGQKFVSWTIDGKTIENEEYTLPATATETDISVTVTFEAIQVTLTLAIEGEGGINPSVKPNSVDPDNEMKGMYDINTKVTLTATPADGWRFDKWVISGGEDENGNPITETVDVVDYVVTVDVNKTATAHFVEQVTLTLIIEETLGKVNGLNAGKNKIDKGADFELKATPASGQKFVSWTIDGKTIDYNPHTLTTTEADIGITVTFEAIPQQVTLTLDIEGEGSINPLVKPNSVDPDNEMKGMYDINTEIELTATPNEGWKFDKWEISDEENKTDKTTTITLNQDKSVTAHFVEGEEEEAITSILTEVVSATPYPNPVTSQITLKAKDGDLIQLFSPKGKQQYSTQHTGNETHIIDVSTIPVGVYLVRITDAEGNTTTKRIVKK